MMDGLDAVGETAGAVAVEMAVAALLERGGKVGPCTNCGSPMMGAFCGVCGQPVETHRRSVFVLLHDFIKDIASFDSRILRTARALLFQPGELPLAFRLGRTQRYVPAVRLYLFVSLIFFVALSLSGIAIMQLRLKQTSLQYVSDVSHNVYVIEDGVRTRLSTFKTDDKGNVYLSVPGVPKKIVHSIKVNGDKTVTIATEPHLFARIGTLQGVAPAESKLIADDLKNLEAGGGEKSGFGLWMNQHVARMMRALAVDPASINEPLTQWIPRALIILLPLFALLLAVFYWRQRKKFYFVDHLVFSLNFHAFGFVALLVAAGLAQVLSVRVVGVGLIVWIAAYLLLAMKRFYGQGWTWTTIKFVTAGFIYFTLFLMPAFGLIVLASLIHM